ncbi:hypothetical protein K3495_g8055 [Podosphaera aphanis]|nr:hypothetical protein K3495_g8055 [Podosphaera aphanis]
MKNGVLISYVALDVLFVTSGIVMLVFALSTKSELSRQPDLETVARQLILNTCPLNVMIVNSIMVFATFLVSIPGIVISNSRGWLKVAGGLAMLNALLTLIVGLTIWFETLKTRSNLLNIWDDQPVTTQSLLQTKFDCCGYYNSTAPPFVVDNVCPTAIIAGSKLGCVSSFASFANFFLDVIFTTAFAIVGVDVLFVLSTAIVLKDRKEQERYRHIDEKNFERGI